MINEAKAEFEAAHQGAKVTVEYLPVDGRATRFNGAFNDKNSTRRTSPSSATPTSPATRPPTASPT